MNSKFRNDTEAQFWMIMCSSALQAGRVAANRDIVEIADLFLEEYRERVDDLRASLVRGALPEPTFYCQHEDCNNEPHWCERHVREMCEEVRKEERRRHLSLLAAADNEET